MSTYNGRIKIVSAKPRSKRLRDTGGAVSTASSSREVVAAPSVDLSRYCLKDTFDDLFAKVNLGTAEAPHWAIKAKYNLFSVGWLSFNGANIGGGSGGDTPVAGVRNLANLGDVALDGILPGQVLSWNGNKWVNSTLATSGFDELQLSQYLASHDYVQQSDLSSYATESWVLQKLQSIGGDLFEKVNLGTDAAPVWAIKAKYNLYTVGWLSFRGPNAGGDGSTGTPSTIASNLADLKDVNLGTLAPGQVLAWNGAKWTNTTPVTSGFDESSIADYLSAHDYATHQWVNAQGFLKQHQSLAGYATEQWVNAQGFLTQHQSLAAYLKVDGSNGTHDGVTALIKCLGEATVDITDATKLVTSDVAGDGGVFKYYRRPATAMWAYIAAKVAGNYYNKTQINTALAGKLDKATFDDLFEKVNLGTAAAPVWAIKAKYSFYSVGWLSFNGANIGTGTPVSFGLGSLSDVLLSIPVAGQALVYNGTKWVNSTLATSGLDEASLADYLSTHGYATQAWANGAFVNKSGDTMTGHLTMLAKDVYLKNSTDNSQYVCYGFKNTADAIIAQIGYRNTAKRIIINPVGSSEPWVDAVGKYNLIVGNNELKYNTYSLLHTGNYTSTLDGRYYTESEIDTKLGGYVTLSTTQTITGMKTFTNYTKIEQALMFKGGGSDGIYFSPNDNGNLAINTHTNYLWVKNIGYIRPSGSLTMGSFIKSGGTASQFLMADGSVVTKKTVTAPCDLGWVNNDTGNSSVPTIAVLAYWDGRYSATANTSSNLKYCNQGAFGSACTYREAQFARALYGEEPPTGDINSFWGNRCVLGSINIDTNAPGGNGWYNIVQVAHRNGAGDGASYVGQIALGMTASLDQMYYRSHRTRAWQHVLTERNYASYLDTHFVTLATQQTISAYKLVTGTSSLGTNGFNVGMRFYNSLHQSIEVESNACTMGLGCHSNGSWYWWYGNTGGKNYCMVYNGAIWSFYGQMLVGQRAHITPQYISFNCNNQTGAIYDSTKHGAQIGINNTIGGIEFATHTGTEASYAIRMLIGTGTGNVGFGTTAPQYRVHAVGDILADNGWLRTNGAHGWYNNTYGGGWWMQNSSYIENYGSKHIKITGINDYYAVWINGGGLCCEGHAGVQWGSGHAAVNVGCANDTGQTPLLLAYRAGGGITGANRLFSMEFLNTGSDLWYIFGSAINFKFLATGEFFAKTGIWTDGYLSFKGQNTTSDARLKDIQGRIDLPLSVIAKAPSIIYRWVDSGKMDMGSIAQYWQKYLPLSVSVNPLGRLGMDYSKIALASAISIAQSLLAVRDDVKTLKADVKRLTTENRQLKAEIQQLKLAA